MRLGSRWLARALFSVLRRSATLFGRTVRPRLVLSLVCIGAMLVLVAEAAGSPAPGAPGRAAAARPSQSAARFPAYGHVTRARRRLIPRPLHRPAATARPLRLFGGNLSGAVVDSVGC